MHPPAAACALTLPPSSTRHTSVLAALSLGRPPCSGDDSPLPQVVRHCPAHRAAPAADSAQPRCSGRLCCLGLWAAWRAQPWAAGPHKVLQCLLLVRHQLRHAAGRADLQGGGATAGWLVAQGTTAWTDLHQYERAAGALIGLGSCTACPCSPVTPTSVLCLPAGHTRTSTSTSGCPMSAWMTATYCPTSSGLLPRWDRNRYCCSEASEAWPPPAGRQASRQHTCRHASTSPEHATTCTQTPCHHHRTCRQELSA